MDKKIFSSFISDSNITLRFLAESLKISRPTLNKYITLYDSNKITNEKIETVFNTILELDKNDTNIYEKVERICRLYRRDNELGVADLDMQKTDELFNFFNIIQEDFSSGNYDDDIYKLLLLILKTYKSNPIYTHISKYFLVLNNIINENSLSHKDKVFISNLYPLLREFVYGDLDFKKIEYTKYINRARELSTNFDFKSENLKNELLSKIKDKNLSKEDKLLLIEDILELK